MRIKLAIALLGISVLGVALSSAEAQTYELPYPGRPPASRCPATVECPLDHDDMYPNGGSGYYSHVHLGQLHSVHIHCE
jgi:hypothetical protein